MDYLEPEFQGPYGAWTKTPGPKTTGQFLKAIDPVLQSAMRTYAGKTPSPTLRSKAKIMALEAAKRYDPSRAKLRTHLMFHLQGLRRAAAREGQIITIPERIGLDLHHLRSTERELEDRLGRPPSDQELTDHLGLSHRRLAHIRLASSGLAEGQIVTGNDDGGGAAFNPAVVSQNDDAWVRFVHGDLRPIDQLILEHTLGMNGKPRLSKQQIAARLRLSPGAVSQRAAKIQAMLDKQSEIGSFFG